MRSRKALTSYHRESRFKSISSTDSSGAATSGRPMRKSPGVSADMSFESSLRGAIGREFKHASI